MNLTFGWGVAVVIGLYLLMMVVAGYVARRARRNHSLTDFYLAGKTLGPFVLFLTLYATQYSGNALVGYPGEAYRIGYAWIMSVGFMMAIIVIYLLFAPRLHRLAKQYNYVTPGDWIEHRFGSPALTWFANGLFVITLSNYLLAQLMAMGHVVAGLSGNAVPYWVGVVVLTLTVAMYETMGGMRAVAWTDCVQGLMLLIGLLGMLIAATPGPDHLRVTTEWIMAHQPHKAAVPSLEMCSTWLSTTLLVGFSAAVYPQAIQRIYAARNATTLKRSLSMMVFMPLVTMLVVYLIGILSIPHFASLKGVAADQVMPLLVREWAHQSPWMYVMGALVFTGTLAAIMSTADSVLLSLSSILAKDCLGKTVLKHAPEERLTRIGKYLSWGIVGVLILLALVPRITLWGLTELKMEVLAQVSPMFILSLLWPRLTARAALTGMVVGVGLSLGLAAAGYPKLAGFHAGLIGWVVNLLLCVGLSYLPAMQPRAAAASRSEVQTSG
ncbi:MAG: sodium:solute symporter family protein [Acidobacteriota bacterium]|nr:sodium:solute symporter family protein [Blastocatellia bacterium]MDW8239862.1 sodium:solute symporter family protein [Acidobacteriota bacterium]